MHLFSPWLLPLILLFLWQAASAAGLFPPFLAPSPAAVGRAFLSLLADGSLSKHLLVSFGRVLAGFALAFLFAFPLGILSGRSLRLQRLTGPLFEFFRHIPPIATIPLLILWFGIGELPKLAVIVLATFFPVFLNTEHGIRTVDPKLIEMGRVFGLSRRAIFLRLLLPAALPDIFLGIRLGLGYSWRSLIGAELIAATSGLGYLILDAEQMSRPDIVLVGIFAIGILGSMLDALFFKLGNRLLPWQKGGSLHDLP